MPICPNCKRRGEELYAACSSCDGRHLVDEVAYQSQKSDRWLGRSIQDRFVIASLLGRGAMSRVYKAYQPQIERTVAVKLFDVNAIEADGEDKFINERDRFIREARVLANLEHPNCVVLYDFGCDEGGNYLYMAMEHVRGISLRRAVRRGLKLGALVEVTRQMLTALREAHAHEIVHRDLKPENVILTHRRTSDEQIVKVLDFGIAKLLGQQQAKKTKVGLLFGTPAYMSPEQCRGDVDVSPASDIYSVGCMLYEMLTGHLPFQADIPQELVRQHQYEPVPELVPRRGLDLPEGLDGYVGRCLEKEPEDRFRHAGVALERFVEVVGESNTGHLASSLAAMDADGGSKRVSVPGSQVSGAGVDPTGERDAPEVVDERSVDPPSIEDAARIDAPSVSDNTAATDTVRGEQSAAGPPSFSGRPLPGRPILWASAVVAVGLFIALLVATLQVIAG